MRKWILRVLLLILVLVIGAGVLAVVFIDDLAKAGIERGGTYAMGVETRVETVGVNLLGGDVAIRNLHVGNPDGFESPYLLEIGSFDMGANLPSALSSTFELESFVLDGLDLHIEQRLLSSNIGKVLSNLRRRARKRDDDEGPGKRVYIKKLVIRNVSATVYFRGIEGAEQTVSVEIPAIELNDITTDGATNVIMGELFNMLLPVLMEHVLTEGEGMIPSDVLDSLNDELRNLLEKVAGTLKNTFLDALDN